MKTAAARIRHLARQHPLPALAALLAPLIVLAVLLGFQAGGDPPATAGRPPRPAATAPDGAGRISLPQPRRAAAGNEPPPFWLSAVVSDPARPRLPTSAVTVGQPSPPGVALQTAEHVRQLEAAEATPENVQRLNDKVVVWYDQDPARATEWLNATGRFAELSPSLASIAAALGERGHLDIAHEVLENISDETTRRRAVLDVYTLQARTGRITREALSSAGWSQEDINLVFQGD